MSITRLIARPMLASYFVLDGIDAVRHPEEHAAAFQKVQPALERAGVPPVLSSDAIMLSRISGAASAAAGILLAIGKAPRASALTLAALNIPITVINNPIWAAQNTDDRKEKVRGLLRGLAIGGGLILAAVDRDGKPSLSYKLHADAEHRAELASLKSELKEKYAA
ncbi:Uncharacterized membrane protein YphA, DoxX/SURF4 family [Ruaniaceae bacterium KH17]|nr:Uncharacterized membrane protein YphA, DoxX/SURF4 family [Ruaniaceae bacterium KH17]